MHGFVPEWVLWIVGLPLALCVLLVAGMLFSSRTRRALIVPAVLAFLIFVLMPLAIYIWKLDLLAPILIFSGPWIILVAIVVALTRALRNTANTMDAQQDSQGRAP